MTNEVDGKELSYVNYMRVLPGGMCFAHGRYEGTECPKWPACATDTRNPEFVKEGMRQVQPPVDGIALAKEWREKNPAAIAIEQKYANPLYERDEDEIDELLAAYRIEAENALAKPWKAEERLWREREHEYLTKLQSYDAGAEKLLERISELESQAKIYRRRVVPPEVRRYTMVEVQAMHSGANGRFVCEECDASQAVSSGPHHFVCHVCWLTYELDEAREALRKIAEWPFDIMGDCVKDATDLAKKALGEL